MKHNNIFDNLARYEYQEVRRLHNSYHSKIMDAWKRKLMTQDHIQQKSQ